LSFIRPDTFLLVRDISYTLFISINLYKFFSKSFFACVSKICIEFDVFAEIVRILITRWIFEIQRPWWALLQVLLNVICSSFCRLFRLYCPSLLFVVSDSILIITRWSSIIVVLLFPRCNRKTLGYSVQRYKDRRPGESWINIERFWLSNSYQTAQDRYRTTQERSKKILYRDTLLKKLWSNYVPIQHDE